MGGLIRGWIGGWAQSSHGMTPKKKKNQYLGSGRATSWSGGCHHEAPCHGPAPGGSGSAPWSLFHHSMSPWTGNKDLLSLEVMPVLSWCQLDFIQGGDRQKGRGEIHFLTAGSAEAAFWGQSLHSGVPEKMDQQSRHRQKTPLKAGMRKWPRGQ